LCCVWSIPEIVRNVAIVAHRILHFVDKQVTTTIKNEKGTPLRVRQIPAYYTMGLSGRARSSATCYLTLSCANAALGGVPRETT
jgi:hypothetical protein